MIDEKTKSGVLMEVTSIRRYVQENLHGFDEYPAKKFILERLYSIERTLNEHDSQ